MQELKKMKIWICWNHTLTRDNKPTKKTSIRQRHYYRYKRKVSQHLGFL